MHDTKSGGVIIKNMTIVRTDLLPMMGMMEAQGHGSVGWEEKGGRDEGVNIHADSDSRQRLGCWAHGSTTRMCEAKGTGYKSQSWRVSNGRKKNVQTRVIFKLIDNCDNDLTKLIPPITLSDRKCSREMGGRS